MSKVARKVTQHGRVTIPSEVRDELEIEPGDYVVIDVKPLSEENDE